MTPEEKAAFEKNLADLAPESALDPVAQPMPEETTEVQVDAPDFELPDSKLSRPVDDVTGMADDLTKTSKVLEQADPFATFDAEQAQAGPRPANDMDAAKAVDPPHFDMGRHERGKQALPQLDAFMRDMDKQGKLTKDGFLKDGKNPVGIGVDDVEEIRQEIEAGRDPGEALVLWMRKTNAFNGALIDAINAIAQVMDIKFTQLQHIIDGLIRKHS